MLNWVKGILKLIREAIIISLIQFCLFDLILYVPSTFFQLNRDVSSSVEQVLSKDKCVLLKDHNAVMPERLEPEAPRSRVKHSTTEPLRSLLNSAFWGWLSMESQPQNPEFRIDPENFHPCNIKWGI